MIIKTGTISSGDGPRICAYAARQGDNERVLILNDNAPQLLIVDEFAEARGRKNGLLHIIISPDQQLSSDELAATVSAIREEYGFNPDDPETLAMHQSRRADGTMQDHYHLVRPASDSDTGRTYKVYKSKCHDEAVSRLCELMYGHKLTSGAHNNFAANRLREMGHDDFANKVAELAKPCWSSFSHNQHQQAKRNDFDLPALRHQLKLIAELAPNQQPNKLAELIHDLGLELADAFEQGRGRSRINLKLGDKIKSHNANRTLKIKAAEVANFIHETKEHLNGLRSYTPESRTEPARSAKADHRGPEPDPHEQSSDDPAPERLTEYIASSGEGLGSEAAELAAAVERLRPQIAQFAFNRASDLSEVDLEAPPDLNDPNLLIKLARMLRKSLQGAQDTLKRRMSGNYSSMRP
ncbi:hypothetical protein [Ruegeria arenilitoris]|uniref:hypothetical protein n=1 Tax=Ruegeria arenilitoris TaxID=1173585 RepID=UPI00147BF0A3|nr:hypothetical protein [Ruegeria arenilitoris]